MKLISVSNLVRFVIKTCTKLNIDESHALKHSMDVFYNSHSIFENEKNKYTFNDNELIRCKNIMNTCSILHDMCDNKYINEEVGWNFIYEFLKPQMDTHDIDISKKIIMTMSYSKVKKNGYPDVFTNPNDLFIYHIVREGDLLASYDFERCMIYGIYKRDLEYDECFQEAQKLFESRMFQYINMDLFVHEYSKSQAEILHKDAEKRIMNLKKFLL
jgi:hypothetical protein